MKSKNAKIGSLADAWNVRKREKVEDLPRSNDPSNFNLSWILQTPKWLSNDESQRISMFGDFS